MDNKTTRSRSQKRKQEKRSAPDEDSQLAAGWFYARAGNANTNK